MDAEAPACAICGQDSQQSTLVRSVSAGQEALYCMRCFHALIHGMSPEQLRERWKGFQEGQGL